MEWSITFDKDALNSNSNMLRAVNSCLRHQRVSLLQQNIAILSSCISTTSYVEKRRGGNSGDIIKQPFRSSKPKKNKQFKLKRHELQPHKTHLERTKRDKSLEKGNIRNERLWNKLEQDEEFNAELENAFQFIQNLGPQGNYEVTEDFSLNDLDEVEALEKLSMLARAQITGEVLPDDDNSMELSVNDYNFLLNLYAAKGLENEANAMLKRMEANLTPIVNVSDKVDENMDMTVGLWAVPHQIPPNAESYGLYIRSLRGPNSAATAVQTIGRMKAVGITPDTFVYNAAMAASLNCSKPHWVYNLMDRMQTTEGLIPDANSFTILMQTAIRLEKDVSKAEDMFILMRAHISKPHTHAFSILIHGFATIGRVEKAINLYDDLVEIGLTPNVVTFNSLINACAKSHYYSHKAIGFYFEMQELYNYYPDHITYNSVLHACAKTGDIQVAERIIRDMKRHAVPLDDFTYNTLLNVYARAQIKKIVDKAPSNRPKPLGPEGNVPVYQESALYDDETGQLLNNSGRPGTRQFEDELHEMENNEDIEFDDEYEDQEEEFVEEDQADINHAHTGSSEVALEDGKEPLEFPPMDLSKFMSFQEDNIKKAEKLWQELLDSREDISVININSMLNVYANALRLKRAEQFFANEFPKHGKKPDRYTYRVLMHMYTRAKRTSKAEALLQSVRERADNEDANLLDNVIYGWLVDHYARKKLVRKALQTIEDADSRNIAFQEKHLKKIRRLTEKYGIYTELIPEDPNSILFAGSRAQLKAKQNMRAKVIAYNKSVGKKVLLPNSL